jgi:hypothetical protein
MQVCFFCVMVLKEIHRALIWSEVLNFALITATAIISINKQQEVRSLVTQKSL